MRIERLGHGTPAAQHAAAPATLVQSARPRAKPTSRGLHLSVGGTGVRVIKQLQNCAPEYRAVQVGDAPGQRFSLPSRVPSRSCRLSGSPISVRGKSVGTGGRRSKCRSPTRIRGIGRANGATRTMLKDGTVVIELLSGRKRSRDLKKASGDRWGGRSPPRVKNVAAIGMSLAPRTCC